MDYLRTRLVCLDAEKVYAATRAQGFLKRDVEFRAGVAGGTIAKAYSGRAIANCSARRIAKALKVKLDDLLARELAEAGAR